MSRECVFCLTDNHPHWLFGMMMRGDAFTVCKKLEYEFACRTGKDNNIACKFTTLTEKDCPGYKGRSD
jgi:hypothetical protein